MVEVPLGPTGDALQQSQRFRVATIQIGIKQASHHLLVDVVRRRWRPRGIEVTVRLDAKAPFVDEGVELLTAGFVTGGRVHSRQARNHLAEHMKRARCVPAAQIGTRSGFTGALAEALQIIVVRHPQVVITNLQYLAQQRPVVEGYPAIIEWIDHLGAQRLNLRPGAERCCQRNQKDCCCSLRMSLSPRCAFASTRYLPLGKTCRRFPLSPSEGERDGVRGKNRFSLSGRAAHARGGSSPGLNLTVGLEASWMIR